MESAIFRAKTKSELKLLVDLAKKLGIEAKWLTREDLEHFGLAKAIKATLRKSWIVREAVSSRDHLLMVNP